VTTATRSSRDMLEWQYKTLLGELQQIELHVSSGDCPCILKDLDPAEYCLAKHTLNVATLAAETANMDQPQAKILLKITDEAQEKHDKVKSFVCHKGELPELAKWAREARKKIEPLYYACRVKATMHQEPMVNTCRQETNMEQTAKMELCPACLLALASGKVSTKEYQTGDEIYYTGDMANMPDTGIIVKVRPPTKYGPLSYDIHLYDGRDFKGVAWLSFEPGPGTRFYLLREWKQEQARKLQELKDTYLKHQAHVESHVSAKKVCTPSQAGKREDCIMDLKETNREKGCKAEGTGSKRCPNVFAVCSAAINCRPGGVAERN
jgi:hypothetical protein